STVLSSYVQDVLKVIRIYFYSFAAKLFHRKPMAHRNSLHVHRQILEGSGICSHNAWNDLTDLQAQTSFRKPISRAFIQAKQNCNIQRNEKIQLFKNNSNHIWDTLYNH